MIVLGVECGGIGEVLRAGGGAFVLKKVVEADVVNGKGVEDALDACGPGILEGNALDAGDDVDAVGGITELDDGIRFQEILFGEAEAGEAELAEDAEDSGKRGWPWKLTAWPPTTIPLCLNSWLG